ncbi:MAG: hypothetical protein IJS32_08550 [Kiritimatiellae bacterium]|nr:hypothetical protein [Kiritimatiellia bacterium]
MADESLEIKVELVGAENASRQVGALQTSVDNANKAVAETARAAGSASSALSGYERVGQIFQRSQKGIRDKIFATNMALWEQERALKRVKDHVGWSAGVAEKFSAGKAGSGLGGFFTGIGGSATSLVFAAQSVVTAWRDVAAKIREARQAHEEAAERAAERTRAIAGIRMQGLIDDARAAANSLDAIAASAWKAQDAYESMQKARTRNDAAVIDTRVARGEMSKEEGDRAKRDRALDDEEAALKERIRRAKNEISWRGAADKDQEKLLAEARAELEAAKAAHGTNGAIWAGMLKQHGSVEAAQKAALKIGVWNGMRQTSLAVEVAQTKVNSLETAIAERSKSKETVADLTGKVRAWEAELGSIGTRRELNRAKDGAEDRAKRERIENLRTTLEEKRASPLTSLLMQRWRLNRDMLQEQDEEKRLKLQQRILELDEKITAEKDRQRKKIDDAKKSQEDLRRRMEDWQAGKAGPEAVRDLAAKRLEAAKKAPDAKTTAGQERIFEAAKALDKANADLADATPEEEAKPLTGRQKWRRAQNAWMKPETADRDKVLGYVSEAEFRRKQGWLVSEKAGEAKSGTDGVEKKQQTTNDILAGILKALQ